MSAARRASDDRSIGGIRMTDERVAAVTGRPGTGIGDEADGGELGALETGKAGTETCTLGTAADRLGSAADRLGTPADMLGTETCTLGTEPGRLGTETCTYRAVLDAETGTAGVETWGAAPLLWMWCAAGAEEDVDADGAGELGAEAAVPGEADWPDETAAAPVAGCTTAPAAGGVAEGVGGATAAAPDALDAAPATAGADTAGSATPPALAAVSTAR